MGSFRDEDSALALRAVHEDAERRARQQAVVAELGRRALGGVSVRELFAWAVPAIAETLGVPFASVLELTPAGTFVVRAAVGWSPELMEREIGSTDQNTHASFTLREGKPVVVRDLATETRFAVSEGMLARGLRSGAMVPIAVGGERPFGLVAAHATDSSAFWSAQVDFLSAIANTLGAAIARESESARVRASEERLRLAADAANLGTWDWNSVTGELTWSERTRQIYGVPPDVEITYELYSSMIPPEERAEHERRVATAFDRASGGTFRSEHRIVRAVDGETRWLLAHGRALFDERGRPVRVLGTTLDVTAQVRAREHAGAARAALIESEERRRLALDAAALGTWDWHFPGGEIDVDARARAILGLPPEGAVDRTLFLAHIHPDDRASVERGMTEELAAGREVSLATEYRVVLADGGTRWASSSGRVHFGADGRPMRAVGIVQDVTARREAEERAREASRAKDEFLAMLGHELRNPLAPIMTAVQLMRLRGAADGERERAVIERQVRHLAHLVDDLLDVSRITAGRIRLELEALDMRDIVARAIETVSPVIESRRHVLTVLLPPDTSPLDVSGDPTRLAQVFSNLLANAAKYTPPGGNIEIEALRVGDEVAIAVRDDGMGIPLELLPRLFEPFAQGRQSLDRAGGGLGLGLAIVKTLVTLHGGRVAAKSRGEGRGTEVVVQLPVVPVAPAVSVGAAAPEHLRATPRAAAPVPGGAAGAVPGTMAVANGLGRILLVDDNTDAAELLRIALTTNGFEVATAEDGPEALALAEARRPDIAVLDLGLPVMDGFELAGRLRSLPGFASVPIIALTGYGQLKDREQSKRAGFDAHLVKPVDLHELTQTVLALVRRVDGQPR